MPNTVNVFLNVPNTGDLPGAWGTTAVNYNMAALDGHLGGFATLALSSATTIILSLPAGAAFTPGAGPTQSENALLKFTGTLTGNAIIKFTMPGYYIVQNACASAAAFTIQLSPATGVGNSIGAPPGKKCHVFFDGTDMDYVNAPDPGTALDLHQNTSSLPKWMTVCTVSPYVLKDGTVYNASTYTALAQVLGSTFGGNGATTFGVPDERNRMRIAVDPGGATGRITAGVSGINGGTLNSAGGSQFMQSHSHGGTTGVDSPDHTHNYIQSNDSNGSFSGPFAPANVGVFVGTSAGANQRHQHSISTDGSGAAQNMPPTIISFVALIKT